MSRINLRACVGREIGLTHRRRGVVLTHARLRVDTLVVALALYCERRLVIRPMIRPCVITAEVCYLLTDHLLPLAIQWPAESCIYWRYCCLAIGRR